MRNEYTIILPNSFLTQLQIVVSANNAPYTVDYTTINTYCNTFATMFTETGATIDILAYVVNNVLADNITIPVARIALSQMVAEGEFGPASADRMQDISMLSIVGCIRNLKRQHLSLVRKLLAPFFLHLAFSFFPSFLFSQVYTDLLDQSNSFSALQMSLCYSTLPPPRLHVKTRRSFDTIQNT